MISINNKGVKNMRKITLKMRIKYANRKERQVTNDCHRYGLPCGACAIKRKLHYKNRWNDQGVNMDTAKKIKLLQKLLEQKYPAEVYDIAEKNSFFRLRVDKLLNKLNKLEEEV